MPPTLSKPHVDGCNDYKMRIDFILNPVKNTGPDNFYFEQPCMCTKDMKVDIVANI